jgi:CPA2 family monovalent cation:H+ antiporter-2
MLFNPLILVEHPASVLATVAIIIVGKALAALAIVIAFGYPMRTALLIAVSLGQIGEFSFILANLGVALQLLPAQGRELILAGALISIMLNPLLFHLLETFGPAEVLTKDPVPNKAPAPSKPTTVTKQTGHTVLVGYGRVGSIVGERLLARGEPIFVIEDREDAVAALRERKIEAIAANAVNALRSANLGAAKRLIVAVPDCFEAGQIVEQARATNTGLRIIARAHSDAEAKYLKEYGASDVVQGSRETAEAMIASLDQSPDHPDA